MITKRESKIIKQLLGSKYVQQLQFFFLDQKVTHPTTKRPYSKATLSAVLNGQESNDTIEKGIWDYVEHVTQKKREEQIRREALLEEAQNYTDV